MDIESLPLCGAGGLIDVLAKIPDPRSRSGLRHPSKALLAASICAVLSGHKSFIAIAEWIADQSEETRKSLGFLRPEPPSERTIRAFLQRLDAKKFSARICEWFEDHRGIEACEVIAIDGKTLRGSLGSFSNAVQLVSAVTHRDGITISQDEIKSGDEIGAVQGLIADLDLTGKTVTFDALHTQKQTAKMIVDLKNADYVMTVENKSHWIRDVIFQEDLSQIRSQKGPSVFAILRNTAISIFKLASATCVASQLRACSRNQSLALRAIGIAMNA
jgi:predicted transposase YbfD/YdcC